MNTINPVNTRDFIGYNILNSIIIYLKNNEHSANNQESHTETCHTDDTGGYNDCSGVSV
jgi:hypothetical protein